jgi:hypothetical protein
MQVKWSRQGKKRRGMKSASNAIEWYDNDPVCASNASDRTLKVIDEIQHFVSEEYKKSLKQWSSESNFRKQ